MAAKVVETCLDGVRYDNRINSYKIKFVVWAQLKQDLT
jgi:hypothetical protein